jgi:predicted transcriptional regulator
MYRMAIRLLLGGLVKRTMTLNLTPPEMEALEQLAQKKDLSKTAVIRQALRLYQTISLRLEEGEKLVFEGAKNDQKTEVMVL